MLVSLPYIRLRAQLLNLFRGNRTVKVVHVTLSHYFRSVYKLSHLILKRIKKVALAHFLVLGLLGATVQPFGSFVSNLFTRWGDLDISVDLFSGSSILFTGKKQKQTLLGHLLRALRGSGNSLSFFFLVFSLLHGFLPYTLLV